MTKAALSLSMKQLEEECGYEIVERTYRGVRLTEKGQQTLKLAERVISTLDDIIQIGDDIEIKEEKYNLVIDRSCLRLLSNKILKPNSKVLERFNIQETEHIGMNYFDYLEEKTIVVSLQYQSNREILENDTRINVKYLYASKQYPASSKHTKYIRDNVKRISEEEFAELPKIKLKSPLDRTKNNIVLFTDDSSVVVKAIENDHGVSLITKFAPDVYCFDHSNLKIYEPFDEEIYITMIIKKDEETNILHQLESMIKE